MKIENLKIYKDHFENIYIDDNTRIIKEKYFINSVFDVKNNPSVTKVCIDNRCYNGFLYKIKDYSSLTDLKNVQVISLYDVLYDELSTAFKKKGLDENVSPSTLTKEQFEIVFEHVKIFFTDIKGYDLEMVIEYMIYEEQGSVLENEKMITYTEEWKEQYNRLKNKYRNEENIRNEELPGIRDITYDHIIKSIILNNIDIEINVLKENERIKLGDIFYYFPLDQNTPLMALDKKQIESDGQKNPVIKVYDKLEEVGLSSKKIKSWVLNEKLTQKITTYKYINGLMIKTRLISTVYPDVFITITLKQNGFIQLNIKMEKPITSINGLMYMINQTVNDILIKINNYTVTKLNPVIIQLKHIVSCDISFEVDFFIDQLNTYDVLAQDYIKENLLRIKDTTTPDIISAYYVKNMSHILINIEDNKYDANSSIIKVYNITSLNEGHVIVSNIYILNEIFKVSDTNIRFIKIREERETGKSRKCQHKPIILKENEAALELEIDHVIKFNNKIYKCNTEKYPYIGFTRSSIACCFQKSQSGKEPFLLNVNPGSLDVLVSPSNLKVTITLPNGRVIETYVIKIVSPLKYGIKNMPIYYYIGLEDTLVPIMDETLLNEINATENIWSNVVSLSKILYPSEQLANKNKPNFKKRDLQNLHNMCSEHDKANYFGYNKGIPHCFNTQPSLIQDTRDVSVYETSLLKNELNDKQIGELPTLLKGALSSTGLYYKIGILRINSFINAVAMGVVNKSISEMHYSIFKRDLLDYLESSDTNSIRFPERFKTRKNYVDYITSHFNNYEDIYWRDIIDCLEDYTRHNIIILNEIEVGKNIEDYKIICKNDFKYDKYVVLFKQDLSFEVICKPLKQSLNMDIKKVVDLIVDKKVQRLFLKTQFTEKDEFINLLVAYHNTTCQTVNKYPEGYPYLELFDIKYIFKIFDSIKDKTKLGELKYKIINNFNKIIFVMTDKHFLIPVKEIKQDLILQLEKMYIMDLVNSYLLLTVDEYQTYLNVLNTYLQKDKVRIEIREVMDSNISQVGGLLSNMGVIIPYKQIKRENSKKIYYPNIDEVLKRDTRDTITKKVLSHIQQILEIRKQLSDKIQASKSKDKIIKYVKRIIKNVELSRDEKIEEIINVLEKIRPSLNLSNLSIDIPFAFKNIANEMINDNVNNTLLSGIKLETTDIPYNTILNNINEIEKWSKNYEQIIEE